MNKEENTYKTGTTTVGIVSKDSVVLAADTKESMGHIAAGGNATKVFKINKNIAITIAGSHGDLLTLIRHLKNHANLYELEHKKALSTKSCVTILSNILNSNKMVPFYVQFIVGGADKSLYSLDFIGGSSKSELYTVSGSGSELALSVLDKGHKKTISTKEAVELAKDAVTAAKKRDIYTGGEGMKIVVIDKNGIDELPIAKYK